jgi:hypothetical protein
MAAPVDPTASEFTPGELQCLQWLQTNVVASRGVALSSQQLQQLAVHVGDDAVRRAMRCCGQCCWPVLRGAILIVFVRYCWYAPQTLAHTAMVAAAMSAHGEVVAWCEANTTARPWVVAPALVCPSFCESGICAFNLSHVCEREGHHCGDSYRTSALLAACGAGDMALVAALIERHAACAAAARDARVQDDVSAAVSFWRRCCRCLQRSEVRCASSCRRGAGPSPQGRMHLGGRSALGMACDRGDLTLARWLIAVAGVDARGNATASVSANLNLKFTSLDVVPKRLACMNGLCLLCISWSS